LAEFLDLYGFLSVILHAAELVAVVALLGGVLFQALLVPSLARAPLGSHLGAPLGSPLGGLPPAEAATLTGIGRGLMLQAGLAALLLLLLGGVGDAVALMAMLEASVDRAIGAEVFRVRALAGLAVLALLVLATPTAAPGPGRRAGLLAGGLVLLAALTAGSHATAREHGRALLLLASFLHLAGAALWIGGLPALLAALRLLPEPAARAVGQRYSVFAASGVGLILLGIFGFWLGYIGSPEAVWGTAYGSMAFAKALMLGLLLLLGGANFLLLHRLGGRSGGLLRVRRFVECEMAIGIAVLALAGSLTSVPPAIDLPDDRVTWGEIVERFTPQWPRLGSPSQADVALAGLQARLDDDWHRAQALARPTALAPGELLLPPRSAQDIAWSEYNHHWAGILVLLVGLAALLDATGRVPAARHWPLLFLGLAGFVLVRSDPEAWPLGDIPLLASLRDPEVLQHKIAGLLVVGFAIAEWRVRLARPANGTGSGATDGASAGRLRFVFPVAMLAGGVLLLAHSHAISNIKEAQLVELSHLPLALLAVIGGCARWVELRGPEPLGRYARGAWPACLVLIGALLLIYREA
jgi:putative copper resistance protein D